MKAKIDNALKKIQLWQAECKLVILMIAAISTVAVFVRRLLEGKIEPISESVSRSGGSGSNAALAMIEPMSKKEMINSFLASDMFLILLLVLFAVGITFYLLKIIKKRMIQA